MMITIFANSEIVRQKSFGKLCVDVYRCWELASSRILRTSERIVEYISKFEFLLSKIIEAKDCIVRDKNFRSGKRYVRADNKAECKAKPRGRERKHKNNATKTPYRHGRQRRRKIFIIMYYSVC
jgi:hypothetical protein